MAQKAGNACSVLLHRMASLAAIELFIKLEVPLLNWVPIRTGGCEERPCLGWPGVSKPGGGCGKAHSGPLTYPGEHSVLPRLVTLLTGSCHLPDRNPSLQHGLRTCLLGGSGERQPASQPLGRFAGGSPLQG